MTDAARPTSEQRLDETFARIRDPKLEGGKVFTTLYETSARREAEASDARVAAGKAIGPLDGRIVSIKDLFDVAGEPTRAGSALLRRQPPATADAPVVRRLRVAGAVIVGKTQMTEFAFSALGTNPHHPVAGKNLGYAEVGRVDGFWGSRTVGALSAFQAHEGLPVTGTYDEATRAAMAEAIKRPVSPARKDITADELKEEGSRTIATADNLSMFGKAKLWLAGVTGGGAIIDWISDGTVDTFQGVWDRVAKIPVSFILFIVFLVVSGLVVMYVAEKIKAYKVEDYASGRLS